MLDAKRELVQAWLVKAQHDLAAARKLGAGPDPYLDIAIYHCQQAAEKAVKGFLAFHDGPLVRTHDVEVLARLAMRHERRFSEWLEASARLTPYATEFRYPGGEAAPTPAEFEQALNDSEGIYSFVLSTLPEPAHPQS
jgi:HEPN domain-containing protein